LQRVVGHAGVLVVRAFFEQPAVEVGHIANRFAEEAALIDAH
jgi:hypothetical protein